MRAGCGVVSKMLEKRKMLRLKYLFFESWRAKPEADWGGRKAVDFGRNPAGPR